MSRPLRRIGRRLPLLDVGAGGVFYGRVLLAADVGRVDLLAGAGLEPALPVLPPGALVLGGGRTPLLGCARLAGVATLVDPVPPLALRSEERRVGKECRSRWSPYH